MKSILRGALMALAALLPLAGGAYAQAYPQRPIRLIVPFPPGGSTDVSARILAQELGARLGQTIVTENRPGAGTMIGTEAVARSAPDGYTLLYASSSISITPSLNRSVTFDPRRDLAPVTMFIQAPLILISNRQVPFNSVSGLIDYAKANPGKLNIAYPGMGTTNHLAAALFNRSAGTDIVLAPFAGNAAGLTALMRNDVQLAVDSVASAAPFIQDGSLQAIAVTGLARSPSMPELPTVAESGLAGFETSFWFGLMAPAHTPDAILTRLAEETRAVVKDPAVIAKLSTLGFETAAHGPEHFAQRIAADFSKWGELIRQARIGAD